MNDELSPLLAAYGVSSPPAEVHSLGAAGGFSGARFWKILDPAGPLCLRRWPPEHPSPDRLQFIHAVLRHVSQAGFRLIPVPRLSRSSETFVHHAGHLWELTPWLPGQADFHRQPTTQKLAAAMRALAQFHQAAAGFPVAASLGPSPGIVQRLRLLQTWQAHELDRLAAAITPGRWPELDGRSALILKYFRTLAGPAREALEHDAQLEVPLTPCIRDIWHAHVLFIGAEVSGLVDFGSMEVDNLAADLARLLGSLARDDPHQWQIGIEAFGQLRPLGGHERLLLASFDRSTVLMAGLNWLKWVYLDQREFADPPAVIRRIDEILDRLSHATAPHASLGGLAQGNRR